MTHSGPAPETHSSQPHDTPARAAVVDESLASALGRIPSGLFVVTWQDAGRDRGMLASWVMQAGFAPPAITIAVAPGRDLLAAIDGGAPFTVNVLGDGQRPLLARFGRPAAAGEDPFTGLAIGRSPHGSVVFNDAVAWLECASRGRIDGVDHVVVLAEVTAASSGRDTDPLVHLRKNGLRY